MMLGIMSRDKTFVVLKVVETALKLRSEDDHLAEYVCFGEGYLCKSAGNVQIVES